MLIDDVDGYRYDGNCYRQQQEQELFPEFNFSCDQSFKPDYDDDDLCEGGGLGDEYNLDDVNNFGRYNECVKASDVQLKPED